MREPTMPERIELPRGLDWLRTQDGGPEWLEATPRLVREAADAWRIRLGSPFLDAFESIALPATLPDGGEAVLKVHFPNRENEHEAEALARWEGSGAVRLLERDPVRHALLIERCVPGTPLGDLEADDALDVLIALLPRLWVPAGPPFRPLADEADWWAADLADDWDRAGRPFERRLVDAALEILRTLPASQGEPVLLHQDLHGGNVLAAGREPWLVIDPKPLVGEREFGLAPIVRSFELGHSRGHVLGRLDRLTAELGLDRERARLWAIAQTVAWSVGSDCREQHVETTRWLLDA